MTFEDIQEQRRKQIGETIANLQASVKLKNIDIARELGVTPAVVGQWIKGTKLPSSKNMDALALIFGVPVESLSPDIKALQLCHGEFELEELGSLTNLTYKGQKLTDAQREKLLLMIKILFE